MAHQSQAREGPTLRDYGRVLRRGRWLILAVALAVPLVALVLSLLQQPLYQGTAHVLLTQNTVNDSSSSPLAQEFAADPERAVQTQVQVAGEPVVAERVRRSLGLSSRSATQIRNETTITAENQTTILDFAVKDRNPRLASRLATEYARQYTIYRSELDTSSLRRALVDVRRRITALQTSDKRSPLLTSLNDRETQLQTQEALQTSRALVVRRAGPATQVQPKVIRNVIIGLLIGLVLGVMLAFIREALDNRVRSATEIGHDVGPILGHVRSDAWGKVGVSWNGSAQGMSEADFEAFRILRANLEFLDADRRIQTMMVTSALPEEGKSTVASSLASAYVMAGKRTVLVECDLRRPTLASRTGLDSAPGLTDVLVEKVTLEQAIQRVPVYGQARNGETTPADPTLECITAGTLPPRPAELIGSQRFVDVLGALKREYDTVILDSTPLLSVVDAREILPNVDAVLVCVRVLKTTREQASAARSVLDHLPERPTGVVLTGLKPGHEHDYGYYGYGYASSESTVS